MRIIFNQIKLSLFCALLFMSVGCFAQKSYVDCQHHNTSCEPSDVDYRVTAIDSIGSYYIIYVKTDSLKFRIVTMKHEKPYRNITIDSVYTLNLYSFHIQEFNPCHVQESFPDTCQVGIPLCKDGYFNIYYSEDIKGLCYKCDKNLGKRLIDKYLDDGLNFVGVNRVIRDESGKIVPIITDKNKGMEKKKRRKHNPN